MRETAELAGRGKDGPGETGPHFVAVIGDMVGSRELTPDQRSAAQARFVQLMAELNAEFTQDMAGRFAITQGDEFEGLMRVESVARCLPTLVWRISERFPTPVLRLGIGLGRIDTEIPVPAESSITLDGPAFHRARAAVQRAAKEQQLGGVFLGFGEREDAILNGLARLLAWQRDKWTDRQREVANKLRLGDNQITIARETGRWRQAISADVQATGWKAYVEGERAWQSALEIAAQRFQVGT